MKARRVMRAGLAEIFEALADLSPRRRAHFLNDHFAHAGVAQVLFVAAAEVEARSAALDAIDDHVVARAALRPFHDIALADGLAVSFAAIFAVGVFTLAFTLAVLLIHLVADQRSAQRADTGADQGAFAGPGVRHRADEPADRRAACSANQRARARLGLASD